MNVNVVGLIPYALLAGFGAATGAWVTVLIIMVIWFILVEVLAK